MMNLPVAGVALAVFSTALVCTIPILRGVMNISCVAAAIVILLPMGGPTYVTALHRFADTIIGDDAPGDGDSNARTVALDRDGMLRVRNFNGFHDAVIPRRQQTFVKPVKLREARQACSGAWNAVAWTSAGPRCERCDRSALCHRRRYGVAK